MVVVGLGNWLFYAELGVAMNGCGYDDVLLETGWLGNVFVGRWVGVMVIRVINKECEGNFLWSGE